MPQFDLISWCENFVEKDFSRDYAETAFPQIFHTRKVSQITVFYAVSTFYEDQPDFLVLHFGSNDLNN